MMKDLYQRMTALKSDMMFVMDNRPLMAAGVCAAVGAVVGVVIGAVVG